METAIFSQESKLRQEKSKGRLWTTSSGVNFEPATFKNIYIYNTNVIDILRG